MSNLWDEIAPIVDGFSRLGQLADLNAQLHEARTTDRKTCGHCYFWMKSRECPKEKNIKGMSRGPSMNGPACQKFHLEQWVADLKIKRMKEVHERAAELGVQL